MKNILCGLLLSHMVLIISYGQGQDNGNLFERNIDVKAYYHIYSPLFLAKPTIKNIADVKYDYPEQLMTSIISATSQEWVNLNTYGGSENTCWRITYAARYKL